MKRETPKEMLNSTITALILCAISAFIFQISWNSITDLFPGLPDQWRWLNYQHSIGLVIVVRVLSAILRMPFEVRRVENEKP